MGRERSRRVSSKLARKGMAANPREFFILVCEHAPRRELQSQAGRRRRARMRTFRREYASFALLVPSASQHDALACGRRTVLSFVAWLLRGRMLEEAALRLAILLTPSLVDAELVISICISVVATLRAIACRYGNSCDQQKDPVGENRYSFTRPQPRGHSVAQRGPRRRQAQACWQTRCSQPTCRRTRRAT